MQARDTKKQQLWAVASIDREALQLHAARGLNAQSIRCGTSRPERQPSRWEQEAPDPR